LSAPLSYSGCLAMPLAPTLFISAPTIIHSYRDDLVDCATRFPKRLAVTPYHLSRSGKSFELSSSDVRNFAKCDSPKTLVSNLRSPFLDAIAKASHNSTTPEGICPLVRTNTNHTIVVMSSKSS
jgi:hypothetical protein